MIRVGEHPNLILSQESEQEMGAIQGSLALLSVLLYLAMASTGASIGWLTAIATSTKPQHGTVICSAGSMAQTDKTQ